MICWDRAVVSLNLRCGHNFCTDCLEEAAKHDHKASAGQKSDGDRSATCWLRF